ncbi:hypothetical protein POX_f07360 [Penicillium oxalicum]|uniref:hypothetical protein n=1 Tax=Penicillium oxalicum TaxID=69781 RepID=UPI0020B728B0|nr:hypothetical protein POX_f07360 [Penicillium oxalicum]KAI2787007.1 hypothetical protein POX_f07360 [Penicillium oxalicum]
MYLDSKSVISLQVSRTRYHLQEGSRSSRGPEETPQSSIGSRVSQLAALISITTSQSPLPSDKTNEPSGRSSFLFGDIDQEATDTVSNYFSTTSVSTVNSSLSASTAIEIDGQSGQSLSDGISPWETSAASMLDYETKNDTANDTLLGIISTYTSADTLLPPYMDTTIRPTVMTDLPSETSARHFTSAVYDTMRDPSHSHLHLTPSTGSSLIKVPGHPGTETTSMPNSWINSVSSSLITTETATGMEVPDVGGTETVSQTANPSSPAGYDPTMCNTRASQTIPGKSLGAALGAVSGAGFLFAIVYILQPFIYAYFVKFQDKTRSTASNEVKSHEEESNSTYYRSEKEISRFSIDS